VLRLFLKNENDFTFEGRNGVVPSLTEISDDTETVGLVEQFLALRVGY